MGINFGNNYRNSFLVSHEDGYEEYRGMDGDDVYIVHPRLADDVKISDSSGYNTIVLGNATIASSDFVSAGVVFHYASGGSLKVLGDVSRYLFVFGGGTAPFDPTSGGTVRSFAETAAAFGVDPGSLSLSAIKHGTVSGTIQSDGSILADNTNTDVFPVFMEAGGYYQARSDRDEAFIYEFAENAAGEMEGRNGTVNISGFDFEHDSIRFRDQEGTFPSLDVFRKYGYAVTQNVFESETLVSLLPEISSDGTRVPSDIVLQGVVLTESQIQIEVV